MLFLSAEYYLGTVPFKASPKACTLRGELVGASGNNHSTDIIDINIDIANKLFSTPTHVALALSTEIEASIEKRYNTWTSDTKPNTPRPSVKFSYHDGRFYLTNERKKGFCLRLGNCDPTSILTKLGFNKTLEVPPGETKEGTTEWEMGNGGEHGGRSLQDQRIRSDPAFGKLRVDVESILGKRRIGRGEEGEVTFHAGHLLVAEYLFSLVFLSMYRGKGRGDGWTMQIQNAAEKAGKVDDSSVDEFETKLSQVCNFDVGTTDQAAPCSIKMVMDEVKKVRLHRVMYRGPVFGATLAVLVRSHR